MTMLRGLEWKYFLFSYGTPFVPAVVFLFIETSAKGKVYGSAFVRKIQCIGHALVNVTDSSARFGAG